MITADQLIAHAIGDYIIQSDWMATEKTKQSLAAAIHAVTYAIPFLFFRPSLAALVFIISTHFIIDRWRLARYLCWAKNWIGPFWRGYIVLPVSNFEGKNRSYLEHNAINLPWRDCKKTGYRENVYIDNMPPWLAVWLMIIADNTLHVLCNGLALRFF